MKEFNELAKLVKELGYKGIWAYMLEIATEIGANIFAGAAIKTILDERYSNSKTSPHDIFMEKLSEELN